MRLLLLLSLLCLSACDLLNQSPDFDFDQLRGGMSSAEVRALPPKRSWTCMEPTSGQGLSRCETPLTVLGDMKATKLYYYFRDDKLISAKIEYTPDAFDALAKLMDSKYKRDANPADAGGVSWAVAGGAVISSATERDHGNVFAYWVSTAEIANELQR